MPEIPRRPPRLGLPAACGLFMVALLVAAALVFYRPFLTRSSVAVAGTPAPATSLSVAEFSVLPGHRACMSLVTVTPDSRLATFQLRPSNTTPGGGPPVELLLTAPGYQGSASVPGGYGRQSVSVPIRPTPKHPVIGTACFVNLGNTTAVFDGSTQGRLSRSSLTIDGEPVAGDIGLTFLTDRSESLLGRLGDVFQHASTLTDGLVPPWAVWIVAFLTAFGVPAVIVVGFSMALSEATDHA